ncbi:hypothetical protein [Candidatus Nitrospira allomarina]|uniref:Uncharacterized protein n=1 Tax=Candidatus Nitrospira allomarina TaxID=3020900 RepID=A0AA96JX67_9BACT|nr:hypothetical protein [Candidatus Nitrospira allomarina]WNM56354.1 hypothetical protein PP769_10185 [Candidatus Nitrospira allomarina]
MSYSMDHLYSPYAHLYQQVFERGHEMKGYNFGNAPTEKKLAAAGPICSPAQMVVNGSPGATQGGPAYSR